MAELKTKKTGGNVRDFLNSVENEQRRKDARVVARIMKRVTGARPEMWGPSIVGYGHYHYVYDSGRENDWFLTGYSPRKQALTLYIMSGFEGKESLMKKLGKHSTGKSCLYIKKIEDVDLEVLEEIVRRSVETIRARSAD